MGTFQLVAAFGFGAIFVKVIDAAWIQPFLAKKELHSWIRDNRLEAYTDLSKNLLAFSLEHKDTKSPFENYAIAARAFLLIDDEGLVKTIDHYIAERDRLFRVSDGKDVLAEGETEDGTYKKLYQDARNIIKLLKVELRSVET